MRVTTIMYIDFRLSSKSTEHNTIYVFVATKLTGTCPGSSGETGNTGGGLLPRSSSE
jgi:hypothetical protein